MGMERQQYLRMTGSHAPVSYLWQVTNLSVTFQIKEGRPDLGIIQRKGLKLQDAVCQSRVLKRSSAIFQCIFMK